MALKRALQFCVPHLPFVFPLTIQEGIWHCLNSIQDFQPDSNKTAVLTASSSLFTFKRQQSFSISLTKVKNSSVYFIFLLHQNIEVFKHRKDLYHHHLYLHCFLKYIFVYIHTQIIKPLTNYLTDCLSSPKGWEEVPTRHLDKLDTFPAL